MPGCDAFDSVECHIYFIFLIFHDEILNAYLIMRNWLSDKNCTVLFHEHFDHPSNMFFHPSFKILICKIHWQSIALNIIITEMLKFFCMPFVSNDLDKLKFSWKHLVYKFYTLMLIFILKYLSMFKAIKIQTYLSNKWFTYQILRIICHNSIQHKQG